MEEKPRYNYCTQSCCDCKRAKDGRWTYGLFFCRCRFGKKLDPKNEQHWNKCPYMKPKNKENKE